MSRILTITNFGDFQFIEQTREPDQIKHRPSGYYVGGHGDGQVLALFEYKEIAARSGKTMEEVMKLAYENRGGRYA